MLSFQQLAQWKNMKSSLAGALPDSVCYKIFKPLNPKEINHQVGLSISHGLSQSPQVYMKFKQQRVDKVYSNYLIFLMAIERFKSRLIDQGDQKFI